MELNFQVTRGDPFYAEIPFADQYGNAVNLNGWVPKADFKKSYSDRTQYFSLSSDNDGLAWKNNDASTGVLCVFIDPDQFDDLDLTQAPRNGERVPFKIVFGDLKLTPPDGVALVPPGGSRLALILKVYAGVTA